MAVHNRSSKQVTQFLGADVTPSNVAGALQSVVNNGLGGERPRQPDTTRGSTSDFESGELNIVEYESALVHMEARGAQPLAAKAMALVLLDVAKAQGVRVDTLLRNTGTQEIALLNNQAYVYINQLRGGGSQLSGSDAIDNSKSLRSRYLIA